jgi:hypothetical protein
MREAGRARSILRQRLKVLFFEMANSADGASAPTQSSALSPQYSLSRDGEECGRGVRTPLSPQYSALVFNSALSTQSSALESDRRLFVVEIVIRVFELGLVGVPFDFLLSLLFGLGDFLVTLGLLPLTLQYGWTWFCQIDSPRTS